MQLSGQQLNFLLLSLEKDINKRPGADELYKVFHSLAADNKIKKSPEKNKGRRLSFQC